VDVAYGALFDKKKTASEKHIILKKKKAAVNR